MMTADWLWLVVAGCALLLWAYVVQDAIWRWSVRQARRDIQDALESSGQAQLLANRVDRLAAIDEAERAIEDASRRLSKLRRIRPWRKI